MPPNSRSLPSKLLEMRNNSVQIRSFLAAFLLNCTHKLLSGVHSHSLSTKIFAGIDRLPPRCLIFAAARKSLNSCSRVGSAKTSNTVPFGNHIPITPATSSSLAQFRTLQILFLPMRRLRYSMNRVLPAAVTPPHKQVSHVDYNRPWFRIDVYKAPAPFDPSTCVTTRGARICYFQTTNLVLKEKREGTKVRVRWITGQSAG